MKNKLLNLIKEFKHPSTQTNLELKWLFIICFFLFTPPLLFFPSYPSPTESWQISLYQFITEKLFITVGTKGPLPFFTILTSIYVSIIMILFGILGFIKFIKYNGVNENFQEKIYSIFFSGEFKLSRKLPFLEKPFVKKFLVSCIVLLVLVIGLAHFLYDEISLPTTSRKGRFFHYCYNYKIGVVVIESLITLFSIVPLFYFSLVTLYLFNYFFRGRSLGRPTIQIKANRRMRKLRYKKPRS